MYRRGSLSVVCHPTTYYSIYNNLLHQAYQFSFSSIIQEDYYQYLSSKKYPEYYQQFSLINFTRKVLPVLLKQNKIPIIVPLFLPEKNITPGLPRNKNSA